MWMVIIMVNYFSIVLSLFSWNFRLPCISSFKMSVACCYHMNIKVGINVEIIKYNIMYKAKTKLLTFQMGKQIGKCEDQKFKNCKDLI